MVASSRPCSFDMLLGGQQVFERAGCLEVLHQLIDVVDATGHDGDRQHETLLGVDLAGART